MMYARSEAEEAQRMGEAEATEAAENKDWLTEGGQGAMAGSSLGPIGALVGAIAGTAYGQKKAYDQRRKEGQGRGSSFFRTLFDTPFGSLKANPVGAASAVGNAKGYQDRQNAMRSTASDEAARRREAQELDRKTAVANGEYGNRYRNYQLRHNPGARPAVQTQAAPPEFYAYDNDYYLDR